MSTTFLRQYHVGRLRTGMMNLWSGPGMKDRKIRPVSPKHIHHLETA
jgi:hypothetical protein